MKKMKKETIVEPTIEDIYQEAVGLFDGLNCMNPCDDKIKMYQGLIKRFKELDEYEDSKTLAVKCNEMIEQTKKDIIEQNYQYALIHKENAVTVAQYEDAVKEFDQLKDYKDSVAMKEICEKKRKAISRQSGRKVKLILAVIVIVVVGAILAQFTKFGSYYKANALMKVTLYSQAAGVYDSLDGYKDSKARYRECEYQQGLRLMKKDDYAHALTAFRHADSHKDSDKYLVQMQRTVLANKKVGKTIQIGNCKWLIIDKQEDSVLLLKKKSMKNIPYSTNTKSVSWRNSSLRAWLNTEFLEDTFKDTEIKNMLGFRISTKDLPLFILSKEELAHYTTATKLKNKSNQWLRDSAGKNSKNIMFLNTDGYVMEEGYPADSDQFSVRPAFWYSFK
ncbi:hypothetical protein lbkm_1061 [Lachnospiraceae bacterium KM106-2]|nr:hypothetical protein lbkm_1061 [Lachnospiraceae bacterium KM106-2]